MRIRTIIQIVLVLVIIALVYFLYDSIMEPVRYENEYNKRSKAVISKLKEIRTLEEAYKVVNGRYMADIDSLILFLQQGRVPVIKKIGDVPDTLTEEKALKMGIISRDTIYMNPLEKLREEKKISITEEQLKDLKYIPYGNGQTFESQASFVDKSGFSVPVIEVKAHFSSFLEGMDKQFVINKIADAEAIKKYPGLKFGSLEQPIIEGNFE